MKILVDLLYLAGGYSADQLTNANATERRQIRQLGRASIISIIASTLSWSIASTLFAPKDSSAALVILLFVVLLVPVLTFSLNRTLFYNSDTARNNNILLPLFRIALITLATSLSYQVLADVPGYGKVVPFILASFELYPILLKLHVGQTIAGNREQARLEHEHMRGNLKKDEYVQSVEQAKIRLVQQPDPSARSICPQLVEFIAENCKKQIKQDATGCIACPHYENVRAMR